MLQSIAKFLSGLGVTANLVTFFGFLVSAVTGVLAGQGMWWAAAAMAVFGGFSDLVDGKVARLHASRSKFGALWDSSLDRYSDMFLIGGIGYFYTTQGHPVAALAAMSAMAGAFQVSYVRARAEGLGYECRVGFWERGERWVLLVAGFVFHNPAAAVFVLAVGTHVTAFHRILHIRALAAGRKPDPGPAGPAEKWAQPVNWVLGGIALAFTALFRWPY